MNTNALYYGDNLDILRRYIADESVDLVYLDPPFNSKASYNILFKERTGEGSAAQIKAFEDTWHWGEEAERAYTEILNSPLASTMTKEIVASLRRALGEKNDMTAYLAMMAVRLLELRHVLKPAGSLYLHCDPTASHYLKIVLDTIFEPRNFRNEIVWAYRGGGARRKDFGHRHDVILRYSKTAGYRFYPDAVRIPYQAEGIGRTDDAMWGKHRGTEKVYKPHPLGKIPEDWWPMNILNANAPERLGYQTQKPLALLERIISASSNEGDVVLDPFCGCGTAVAAAHKLKRQWIGIDVTHLAVALMKHRLKDMFGLEPYKDYQVVGEPVDVAGARQLASEDRYQFQFWALSLLEARPEEPKKGADRGVDGTIFFLDGPQRTAHKAIIQVKSGHVAPTQIRDLKGVVEREGAALGLFISLEEPTREMRTEAASAGFFHSDLMDRDYPKVQIRTVEELLEGKGFEIPLRPVQFQQAPRVRRKGGVQSSMLPGGTP